MKCFRAVLCSPLWSWAATEVWAAAEVWAASEAAASEGPSPKGPSPKGAADVNPKGHEAEVAAQSLLLLLLSQQDEPVQSTEPSGGLALEEVLFTNSDMVVLCLFSFVDVHFYF